jgi:hypothetical protein
MTFHNQRKPSSVFDRKCRMSSAIENLPSLRHPVLEETGMTSLYEAKEFHQGNGSSSHHQTKNDNN